MAHTTPPRTLLSLIACAALCTDPGAAFAADMNSVTGPLPGEVPAAAQCALPAPAAGLAFATAGAHRQVNDATAQAAHATIDGSVKVSQAWTTCRGGFPRGVSASIEVTLPGIPGAQGTGGATVQWGAAASQSASPTLSK